MHSPYNNFLRRMTKALGLLSLVFCLAFSVSNSAKAQGFEVTGQVVDGETDEPIPGANIVEVGTQTGTVTDVDGEFSLTVSEPNVQLRVSFVGFQPQVIDLNGRSNITIALQEMVGQLDDVVVTAFGMERDRKALGYSVSQVSGADLAEAREVNLGDALQGRVAGVNVSNIGSGVAGSSRVVIRGNTSLSGNNEPLYVIDGVPMDNTQLGSASMWGGSDWGDGLTSLNPDDIEDISVLKGASAAALYGSRASNGVVMITTKDGSGAGAQDGIGVELNSNFTAESFINTYDFQNQYGHGTRGRKPATADQGAEFGASAWGARLDGSDVYQFDGVQRPYVSHEDNFSNFYRTGYTNTNTIALTGGTTNQTFRLSMSDLRNESIVPNSGMNRQTVVLSSSGNWADRLTVDTKLQYTREDVKNRARLSDAPGNANYTLTVLPPSIDVQDLKGPTDKLGAQEDGTEMLYSNNIFSQNPYWATHQFVNDNIRDRFMGSGTFRYDLMEWLYVRGRIGMDWYTNRRTNLEPYGTGYNADGAMNEIEQRVRETNLEYMVGFDQSFDDFAVSGLFGGNWMRNSFESLNGSAGEFNIPFLHTIGNGGQQGISYGISEYGINSLFGSAEISWRDLVYLNATARNDWFSTLPEDSNSILYPSIGGSFVFSDAFELPEVVTFGRVRASWAQVGGGTDPYQLALNYSIVGQGHQGAALGRITQNNVPNNELVPLALTEYEVGFDLRLFNNRVGIDYAYYTKKTEDDILNATISSTSGYGGATVNVGEVSNYGHEFLVNVVPVQNIDFNWDVTFNFSYNKNTVESLYQDSKILTAQSARGGGASSQHRIAYTDADGVHFRGGYSVIVGTAHARINGQKVYDADGLPVQDSKQRVLGDGIHPWSGGVQNNFQYKNINFGFLVDFKLGGDLYTGTNATTYSSGMHKATLEGRENGLTISGVDQEGNPQTWNIAADDPNSEGLTTIQDYYSRLSSITEYFVQDASFVKLRSLNIGYQLPARLIEGLPFSNASVSIVGRNLWLIHSKVDNVDPESTYNTSNGQGLEWFGVPQTRSFGLNVNLKF
ncbi:MAG: SusC/RagA family TonB-linked outer membrane protein [Balneolaceae bacterium]|nr:SusC/RagA family TonB-linked outer membrane protein [Balneolaceae bacterium]